VPPMSEDEELSIWDHVQELSSRLRRIMVALVITMMIVMSLPADLEKIIKLDFSDYTLLVSKIIEMLQEAVLPEGVTLIAFNWLDSFYIYVMVAFTISFIICLPYIATQVYAFLAPAIYENEKKGLIVFVSMFVLLFLLGVTYAYFILIPATFRVLYQFVYQTRVMPFYSVKDFFDIISFGLVGSGLFYTFPLVIYTLVVIDIIMVDDLRRMRKHLFLGLAIVTAFLTPDPTPVSMLLMTIPFYILYELTIIILSRIMKNRPSRVIETGLQASLELLGKTEGSNFDS
jgi:sec-independent protein translocase protein TatC